MADPLNTTQPAPPASNPITATTPTSSINANLYNDGERLSSFTPSGDEIDKQVAYFTLVGTNGKSPNKPDDIDKETDIRSYLDELYTSLSGRYDKFILLSINESKSEKAQVLSTHGDHFAAIFTGREPTTISISGQLIADYGDSKSWYRTFMDSYTYFFRASRLAKYNNQMKLVLPDGMEIYVGYPLNISWSSSADSDILCNFNMGFLVVDRYWTKAKMEATSATAGAPAEIKKNIAPPTLPTKPTNVSPLGKIQETLKTVNDAVSTAKKYISVAKTVQNVIKNPNTMLTAIAAGGVFGAEILREKEKYQQFVSTVSAVQTTIQGVAGVVNSVTGNKTLNTEQVNKELSKLRTDVGVVYTANDKIRVLGKRKPKA